MTVSIGGDTSGLKSALNEAASLAVQFAKVIGETVVGEVGTVVGKMVLSQIVGPDALGQIGSFVSSELSRAMAAVDFSAVGSAISGAFASAKTAIDNGAINVAGSIYETVFAAGESAAQMAAKVELASKAASMSYSEFVAAEAAAAESASAASAASVEAAATAASATEGIGVAFFGAMAGITGTISGLIESATAAAGTAAAAASEALVALGAAFSSWWGGMVAELGSNLLTAALAGVTFAVGAAVVAMTQLIEATNAAITAQAILAAQTGTSFQNVATFQGADQLAGTGTGLSDIFGGGKLADILAQLQQVATGSDAVGQAISGVFNNASTANGIEAVVAAFQALPDPVDKARLAVELFGSDAATALALINQKSIDSVNAAHDMADAWDQSTRESMQRITDFANSNIFAGIIPNWSQDWAQLKQTAILSVTGLEDTFHTFFVQLGADWHDAIELINEQIAANGIKLPPPDVPNLSNAQLTQYITAYLKGIQGEGMQPGTIAPPAGYDASKGPQQLADSLVNLYAAYQQLGITNYSQIFSANNSGSGMSDMQAFVALAALGTLGLDRLSGAADTLKGKLESAFEDGAISSKQLDDALQTINATLYATRQAVTGALSQNVVKPFDLGAAFGPDNTDQLSGVIAAGIDKVTAAYNAANPALAAWNDLMDQQASRWASAQAALDGLDQAATDAATAMQALVATVPGQDMTAPWVQVTRAIKEANQAAVDYANTQLANGIAAQMYLIEHPDFTLAEKEWQSFGTVGTQVIADLSNSITNDLSKALADLVTGTKTVSAAFQQMGASILDSILKTVIGAALKPLIAELQQIAASTPGLGNFFNSLTAPTAAQIAGAQGVGGYMGSGTFAGPLPAGGDGGAGFGSQSAASNLGTQISLLITTLASNTSAIAAQTVTDAANVAAGNVIKATFDALPGQISTAVDSTFGPLTEDTIAAIAEQTTATGVKTAAVGVNSAASGENTAADGVNTWAVGTDTGAIPTNTGAVVANTGALTAVTGASATGGVGGALSGILGSIGGAIGADPFGAIGAGVGIASGIVQGDELAQLNNKTWLVVSNTQGTVNQLIDLQQSANEYWPQLLHLTDIWGTLVSIDTTLGTLVSELTASVTSNLSAVNGVQPGAQNLNGSENTVTTSSLKGGIVNRGAALAAGGPYYAQPPAGGEVVDPTPSIDLNTLATQANTSTTRAVAPALDLNTQSVQLSVTQQLEAMGYTAQQSAQIIANTAAVGAGTAAFAANIAQQQAAFAANTAAVQAATLAQETANTQRVLAGSAAYAASIAQASAIPGVLGGGGGGGVGYTADGRTYPLTTTSGAFLVNNAGTEGLNAQTRFPNAAGAPGTPGGVPLPGISQPTDTGPVGSGINLPVTYGPGSGTYTNPGGFLGLTQPLAPYTPPQINPTAPAPVTPTGFGGSAQITVQALNPGARATANALIGQLRSVGIKA